MVDPADDELSIGSFFTPLDWARFAIEQFGIFDKWIEGSSIFDPTMGEGGLLEALILYGLEKGYPLRKLPVQTLAGVEMNSRTFSNFLQGFGVRYKSVFSPGNFTCGDILFNKVPEPRYDIIFGNPPWKNFVDLPDSYKDKVKGCFTQFGLVDDSRKLLLGGSRIDLAALIIQKTIQCNLKNGGDAYFFMPLSLLLNDGASRQFRRFKIKEGSFALKKVFDLNSRNVFAGVNTRYGLVHFNRDSNTEYPIDYQYYTKKGWSTFFAKPLLNPEDSLSILPSRTSNPLENFTPVPIPKHAMPRQGLNTCGMNDIYFFTHNTDLGNGFCQVGNRKYSLTLPRQFVFPLIDKVNFQNDNLTPNRWVLIPYRTDSKPITESEMQEYPEMRAYFHQHEKALKSRKGAFIQTMVKRGYWWALLGVGPYSFAPFKIVWESYGRKVFQPKIFEGNWQAGQSLQAFIPADSEFEAERIWKSLTDSRINEYLLSLKMAGTMNWAQPGKIKKLLKIEG